MIRTFIALELPSVLKSELASLNRRFQPLSPKPTNWVKPEIQHLTLLFIGEVQPRQITEIEELLDNELNGFPAFHFTPEGLEFFPSVAPHLLWLKLAAENDDIFKLNRRLLKDLERMGIDADRKTLKLHVTMARLKARFSPELEREIMQSSLSREALNFNSICLFKSVLHTSGPEYTVLHKYNLR